MSDGHWELPSEWKWTTLGTVVDVTKNHVMPNESPDELFNYLSIENIESISGGLTGFSPTEGIKIRSAKLRFSTHDVLYSKLRPYLNKVHIPIFEGVCATDLIPLRPLRGIPREFVAYYLRSPYVMEYVNTRMRGIQLPRLPVDDLKGLPFPLPPLAEQRRIVARTSSILKESQMARKAMARTSKLADVLRRSVLRKAFKGDWEWTTIGEIAKITMGQSPPGSSYNKSGIGEPILNGPTEFGEEHPSTIQWTTKPTKMCETGDVLLCVRGSTTGRLNLADQRYCIGRGVAAIRSSDVNHRLLQYYLVHALEEIMSRTTGSTFPNLSRDSLESLPFPQLPRDVQSHIADLITSAFSQVSTLENSAISVSESLLQLDQVILTKAFQGTLVEQDSRDEPASVLLERIRMEHASGVGRKCDRWKAS